MAMGDAAYATSANGWRQAVGLQPGQSFHLSRHLPDERKAKRMALARYVTEPGDVSDLHGRACAQREEQIDKNVKRLILENEHLKHAVKKLKDHLRASLSDAAFARIQEALHLDVHYYSPHEGALISGGTIKPESPAQHADLLEESGTPTTTRKSSALQEQVEHLKDELSAANEKLRSMQERLSELQAERRASMMRRGSDAARDIESPPEMNGPGMGPLAAQPSA
eukprot:CAMPEP_0180806130 /NCGR_PEP_ID=MMETSP1038_2-20121128/62418_1 /TAXON_ID=632150 /ORGANISM="Azadinium spinosum, Strain 3D9" /LENGTH=224 /DNA_ID=CAMNT_0022846795 /DNA_START=43 /DNA_END=714 /DNA_ORIENTATION=+